MKRILPFLLLIIAITLQANAQQYLHQVIVLNEGYFDYNNQQQVVPVTVGTYNPSTRAYTTFDFISGSRFATDVLVDNGNIYVAADNKIIRYDANTYAQTGLINLSGVRKLAIWNNQLLATRGEFMQTFTDYFEVFDKNTMSFIYSLPVNNGPGFASEGMVIRNDSCYIAINNGFDWGNYKGLVGVVDLAQQTYVREISLSGGAVNPENIVLSGSKIVTVNNNDFTSTSISTIDIQSGLQSTTSVVNGTGCSTSALCTNAAGDQVFYQAFGDIAIGRFDINSSASLSPVNIGKGIYGMEINPINNDIYCGVTDFTSTGKVFIYYGNGFPKDSFAVGVSPGNFAFDLRNATSVQQVDAQLFSVYPNPAADYLEISANISAPYTLTISDILGRIVYSLASNSTQDLKYVNVSKLPAGIYSLTLNSIQTSRSIRFDKK